MQNKAASLLPHFLLPEPAVSTLVFLQISSCWVVVKVTSVSEPWASLWTSPQPQWSCPNQSLPACVLHAALLPPWTLVLGPGPLACPHWLLGGLLSTNSNPQCQTSHLGGLMGTSDLTPAPGWAAPSHPGLRPKPRSPSCLLPLLPASRLSRSAVDGTGRIFPEAASSLPVSTRKRGPHRSPFTQGHATPLRLHTSRFPERHWVGARRPPGGGSTRDSRKPPGETAS